MSGGRKPCPPAGLRFDQGRSFVGSFHDLRRGLDHAAVVRCFFARSRAQHRRALVVALRGSPAGATLGPPPSSTCIRAPRSWACTVIGASAARHLASRLAARAARPGCARSRSVPPAPLRGSRTATARSADAPFLRAKDFPPSGRHLPRRKAGSALASSLPARGLRLAAGCTGAGSPDPRHPAVSDLELRRSRETRRGARFPGRKPPARWPAASSRPFGQVEMPPPARWPPDAHFRSPPRPVRARFTRSKQFAPFQPLPRAWSYDPRNEDVRPPPTNARPFGHRGSPRAIPPSRLPARLTESLVSPEPTRPGGPAWTLPRSRTRLPRARGTRAPASQHEEAAPFSARLPAAPLPPQWTRLMKSSLDGVPKHWRYFH